MQLLRLIIIHPKADITGLLLRASVKNLTSNDREKILNLKKELEIQWNKNKKLEVDSLINKWEINQFWPKFYVKTPIYESKIYDGGTNPFPYPQAMILLLLKVDDSINNCFELWFEEGVEKGYPGIPLSFLKPYMIKARCEIFFQQII